MNCEPKSIPIICANDRAKSKSENRVYVCAMYLFEFYRDKKHSHYSWSNKSDCWRMCDCRKNKKFCIKQSANIKS